MERDNKNIVHRTSHDYKEGGKITITKGTQI
jgi:hypothetical protein